MDGGQRAVTTCPQVSFVIPVRNDAERLEVCLASIERDAAAAGAPIEIVVVDNGSTDPSAMVARRHGATVLTIGEGRVSELRNKGARMSSGDILAFVDADNEIGAGWVAAALANLSADDVTASGALYAAPEKGTWVQRAYGALRGLTDARRPVDWLGSGNLLVKRAAFNAVDGFDTTLDACEDVDLCQRLRAQGATLLGDPRLRSTHHGDPKTLRALFESERWRGRNNLKVTFRRPIAWRSVPSAMMPLIDLGMLVALLVASLMLTTSVGQAARLAVVALMIIMAGAVVRTARARQTAAADHVRLSEVFAVVLVYNLARAVAVISRAPHRHAQASVREATS